MSNVVRQRIDRDARDILVLGGHGLLDNLAGFGLNCLRIIRDCVEGTLLNFKGSSQFSA